MPVQVGSLIKDLLNAAGYADTSTEVKDALTITATLPDEAGGKVQAHLNGLMTVDQAKNNKQLKDHFTATALKSVDSAIEETLSELGLDDAIIAEILEEKNTYKKTPLSLKKVKEAMEKKGASLTTADKKELAEKIKSLNDQIVAEREAAQKKIQETEGTANGRVMNYAIKALLRSQAYANENLDADTNITTAEVLLNKELAKVGAKVVHDINTDTLKLVQSGSPELDYTENNKSLSFGDFLTRTLTNSKMLKVTGTAPPQQRQGNTQQQKTDGNKGPNVEKVTSAIDEQLKQFENLNA